MEDDDGPFRYNGERGGNDAEHPMVGKTIAFNPIMYPGVDLVGTIIEVNTWMRDVVLQMDRTTWDGGPLLTMSFAAITNIEILTGPVRRDPTLPYSPPPRRPNQQQIDKVGAGSFGEVAKEQDFPTDIGDMYGEQIVVKTVVDKDFRCYNEIYLMETYTNRMEGVIELVGWSCRFKIRNMEFVVSSTGTNFIELKAYAGIPYKLMDPLEILEWLSKEDGYESIEAKLYFPQYGQSLDDWNRKCAKEGVTIGTIPQYKNVLTLLEVVARLHEQDIFHRDIADRNVLIRDVKKLNEHTYDVKLIDFGLAAHLPEIDGDPERMRVRRDGLKRDMWALFLLIGDIMFADYYPAIQSLPTVKFGRDQSIDLHQFLVDENKEYPRPETEILARIWLGFFLPSPIQDVQGLIRYWKSQEVTHAIQCVEKLWDRDPNDNSLSPELEQWIADIRVDLPNRHM
jgi:serine/threonine protein kinase